MAERVGPAYPDPDPQERPMAGPEQAKRLSGIYSAASRSGLAPNAAICRTTRSIRAAKAS